MEWNFTSGIYSTAPPLHFFSIARCISASHGRELLAGVDTQRFDRLEHAERLNTLAVSLKDTGAVRQVILALNVVGRQLFEGR